MIHNLMIMTISILIPLIIIIMNFILSMNKNKIREKITPFECGFDPLSNARLPFSIQFFTISLLFLIFDIEIILILPLILTLKNKLLLSTIIMTLILMLILILGLWMEWMFNYLKWIN